MGSKVEVKLEQLKVVEVDVGNSGWLVMECPVCGGLGCLEALSLMKRKKLKCCHDDCGKVILIKR